MVVGEEGIGKFAVATWGTGDERCRGWVVAHSIAPQVLIVTTSGERIWVREDSARLATPEEIEELATAMIRERVIDGVTE